MSYSVSAFGTTGADKPLEAMTIRRRVCGTDDVRLEILYSGVCHSDIHHSRSEWYPTVYPTVPGHEIVGRVVEVGANVTKVQVGSIVGIGCKVDSCRKCDSCVANEENYCMGGSIDTYGSPEPVIGGTTHGGYSTEYVCTADFVCIIPEGLQSNLPAVAPLLCAGISTYSPLSSNKIGPGSKVGIVGLGGLGHIALKIASAMGAEVTLITTSANKVEDAKRLGASKVLVSKDAEQMKAASGSLDFIIDTVSAKHSYDAIIALLRLGGTLHLVGVPSGPQEISPVHLLLGKKKLTGSVIGGIKETQEMLNFCATHQIFADIEMINVEQINEAWERVLNSDVKFRFVIDVK